VTAWGYFGIFLQGEKFWRTVFDKAEPENRAQLFTIIKCFTAQAQVYKAVLFNPLSYLLRSSQRIQFPEKKFGFNSEMDLYNKTFYGRN
jgi:hypothetical protein